MTQRLLTTKLYIPPARTNLVSRPRLIEQLNAGLRKPLALISAPAGYGKTTLLSDWYARTRSSYPLVWLSLDQNDNHLARFLAYMSAAMETLDLKLTQDFAPLLLLPQLPPIEELITLLVNGASAFRQDFALVLDDYHLITKPAIHTAVAYLLDHMPQKMHLVLLTRADPPIPLARLRARGQMVELRTAELRFTREETSRFFNDVMNLKLSGVNIRALEQHTEGWIAGLQLAALSMQRKEDAADFIQSFTGSNRYILDFLSEEVLQQQPEPVQTFLLQTSILDRLSGPLCDTVLGGSRNSEQMLIELERKNMFLIPLDDDRTWYRYHPLFSDLLFQSLSRTQPELINELYERAAAWHEQHGYLESAIGYALKAHQYELAARLMDQIKNHLWDRGEIRMLIRWLDTLPEELVQSKPELSLNYAACLTVAGYFDAAEKWLQLAEEGYSPIAAYDQKAALRACMIPIYRGVYARFRGDFSGAAALCERGLNEAPVKDVRFQGVAMLFLGQAHFYAGHTQAAENIFTEAIQYTLASGHMEAYLNACHHLAQIRVLQGRLHEASEIYEQAVLLVEERGTPIYAGTEHSGLADLKREWNQLDAAAVEIQKGLELAEAGDHIFFLADVYLARVRLALAQKDWMTAESYLQKAEQVARRCPTSIEIEYMRAWRARLHIAQGNLDEAGRWAAANGVLEQEDSVGPHHEFRLLTLARFWLAWGKIPQAQSLLKRIRIAAEKAGRYGSVLEVGMLQALGDQKAGEERQAVEKLAPVLERAEREGYVRLFLDEGEPTAYLLEKVATQTEASVSSYAKHLLAAYSREQAEPRVPHAKILQSDPVIEQLSKREIEVLRLIANGCANKEIAAQLVISTGTVKRHVIHILRKLSAHNRTEAAAIARRQKII